MFTLFAGHNFGAAVMGQRKAVWKNRSAQEISSILQGSAFRKLVSTKDSATEDEDVNENIGYHLKLVR